MKMMEILKLRIQCMGNVNPKFTKTNLRTIIKVSAAAQEYYTGGHLTRDAIYEIQNAQTHPYLYDGHPTLKPGEIEISKKYGFDMDTTYQMVCLAMALEKDIQNGIADQNGTLDFTHANRSRVLMQYHNGSMNGLPINGLGAVMQQMLARYRAQTQGK